MADFESFNQTVSDTRKQRIFYVAAAAIFIVGIAVFVARPIFSERSLAKDSGPKLIPAEWLSQYFGTSDPEALSVGGYFGDPDLDGLNNYQEYIYNTSPISADTDQDGYPDGNEVAYGRNPNQSLTEVAGLQAEAELSQVGVEIPREEIKQHVEDQMETARSPYVRAWNKSQLQATSDNGETSIDEYADNLKDALSRLSSASTDGLLGSNFEGAAVWQIDNFISEQQSVIDKLSAAIVPTEFLDYHLTLLQINEGFLGMAIAAKQWSPESALTLSGWLFPEVQYIASLEQPYSESRIKLSEKFGISL